MKWEYKRIILEKTSDNAYVTTFDRWLNELGDRGWELISTYHDLNFDKTIYAILKREKK